MAAPFRILAATDGSPSARAALATAMAFPWPQPSRARAVVALGQSAPRLGRNVSNAMTRSLYTERGRAERVLAQRWSDADAFALHDAPVDAILSEARRFHANAIVLGWRGQGALRRLIAGSVSREIVARAAIPVLVARTAVPEVRRVILGFDGSPAARRAVGLASRLEHRRGSQIIVASFVEPLPMPPAASRLAGSMRRSVRGEVASVNRERVERAEERASEAAALARAAGWTARVDVRFGAPLESLLPLASERAGSILVVGARSRGKLAAAFLGSVAAGALNLSRVPVMIVP